MIALIGVALSMWGASWDITSHLLRTPETFFTPSHGVLYAGVGISLISAILCIGILLIKKQTRKQPFAFGLKLIIMGSLFQIIAGPGDFYWHELFGIDGATKSNTSNSCFRNNDCIYRFIDWFYKNTFSSC